MLKSPDVARPEPRWPAVVAVLAAAAMHFALPPFMRVGPPWMLVGTVAVMVTGAWAARRSGWHHGNELMGWAILAVLTVALLFGIVALLVGLVQHSQKAPELLRSATVVWATNVLVFATWYWRLDAGGPNAREQHDAHLHGAFLFPQMAFDAPSSDGTIAERDGWRPGFVDYLFLAFNTSTAFSPTDVPVLSRWAKLVMMTQATISFTAVVLLAGRAVNIL